MSFSQDNDTLQPAVAEDTVKPDSEKASSAHPLKVTRKTASPASSENHERLEKLFTMVRRLIDGKFTGYVKMNFTQGTLGRIEKFEEILKK